MRMNGVSKVLGQLDGVLELVQVRLERLIQPDLADGRADRADLQAVVPNQLAGVRQLLLAQVHDVLLVDEPRLDVADLLLREKLDLRKIFRHFIRKSTQLRHVLVVSYKLSKCHFLKRAAGSGISLLISPSLYPKPGPLRVDRSIWPLRR